MPKLWTDAETTPFMTPWREAQLQTPHGGLESVVDGDSFRLTIDVGFEVDVRAYVRLLGEGAITTPNNKLDDAVDAWEMKGEEKPLGILARTRAAELLQSSGVLRIWSFKGGSKEKYGRWLVVVLVKQDGGWRSVGDILVAEGHAEYTTY